MKALNLAALLVCTQFGRAAGPLDTWTWRNGLPTDNNLRPAVNDLNGVAYVLYLDRLSAVVGSLEEGGW